MESKPPAIIQSPGTGQGEFPVSAVRDTQTYTHSLKKINYKVDFCTIMLPLIDPVQEKREMSWMWSPAVPRTWHRAYRDMFWGKQRNAEIQLFQELK